MNIKKNFLFLSLLLVVACTSQVVGKAPKVSYKSLMSYRHASKQRLFDLLGKGYWELSYHWIFSGDTICCLMPGKECAFHPIPIPSYGWVWKMEKDSLWIEVLGRRGVFYDEHTDTLKVDHWHAYHKNGELVRRDYDVFKVLSVGDTIINLLPVDDYLTDCQPGAIGTYVRMTYRGEKKRNKHPSQKIDDGSKIVWKDGTETKVERYIEDSIGRKATLSLEDGRKINIEKSRRKRILYKKKNNEE